MIPIFIVNEASVFRLLLSVIFRRNSLILGIEPFLPGTKGILNIVVDCIVQRKKAVWAIKEFPELKLIEQIEYRDVFFDVFTQTAAWHNDYFKLADTDLGTGNYVAANKKAIFNYMHLKNVSLLVLRRIFCDSNEGTYKCFGFPSDTYAAGEFFCKRALPGSPGWIPTRLINFTLFIAMTSVALGWIFLRTRFRRIEPERFFFAADFMADPRDVRLYRELEDGGNMLMVNRGHWCKDSPIINELIGYTFCDRGDGLLGLKELVPMLKMIIRDEWRTFQNFKFVYPALFRRLSALPYRRILYRGLFLRYRPKVFWSTDPYNEDHILRRQELHRVGGASWGVTTSTLNCAIMLARYLYVSYDRYYVHGHGKFKKYYGDTWAEDMDVVPAGSFSAERKHYSRRFDHRPPDIAVFTAAYIGEPELVRLVRSLAEAFSDRKIILQVRKKYRHLEWGVDFISECLKGFDNIELASESVYDIFTKARYGISDPSSVVAEALQFGMIIFSFDLPQLQVANIDREYPGLTLNSAEDAIKRIHDIEEGQWHYPVNKFHEVVDMSGMVFFDRIRKDIGLSPKEPSIPLC